MSSRADALIANLQRAWRRRRVRLSVGAIAFAALTAATVLIAYLRTFSGFAIYDDEGYMLIALRSFLEHGHLYDDVFSQYGPAYYGFWGGFFELFGIPVDHDGGRAAVVFAWVTAGLLFGLSIWRITRSILLGLATQMLVFGAIITVANEPMHPGATICLLLGVIVALSSLLGDRSSRLPMALLGAAVMALILVKINVGAFALIAVALVCAGSYARLTRWRWVRPAVEVLFVAVPLLLMGSRLGDGWARHYAIHVAVAALAVVIALRARSSRQREAGELWWLLVGLAVAAAVTCLIVIATGTTPGGLVEGVISQPLRQSDAFTIPIVLTDRTYVFDLLGLAGAAGFFMARRRGFGTDPASALLLALFSLAVGLGMALSIVDRTPFFDADSFYQFAFLPFAWVALIPPLGEDGEDASFAYLLLPPLAVLQALHAFPVAGSQTAWSAFLLIPVGALCVANAVRGLNRVIAEDGQRRVARVIAVAAAIVMMLALVNVQLRHPFNTYRAGYDGTISLDLPGAEDVHVPAAEARTYRRVTRAINANCTSFLTLPGMNSFYIWTELEPPTGYNATAWMTLFDDAHQQRVIAETRSIRGLCLLENPGTIGFWTHGEEPKGPLVDYLREGFRPVTTISGYRLLRRQGAGPPS